MSYGNFTWGGAEPVRGVNAGGWLVLEPWIKPSLFNDKPDWVIDERTYGNYWRSTNYSMGYREISDHWESWITRADFEDMKRLGLNMVRIPIGYWSIIPLDPNEPYMTGAFEFLQRAVVWCRDIGLGVLIDLHGVPASQNGFDNSGDASSRAWFTNPSAITRTLSAISILTLEFTSPTPYSTTVVGIELVNEPFPYSDAELEILREYYRDGYETVRTVDGDVPVVLSDAFQKVASWGSFMPSDRYDAVALDVHIYSMFTIELVEQGYTDHLRTFCSRLPELQESNRNLWTIVGEFTTASTDCAAYLNGRGKGARWDSTTDPRPTNLSGNCKGKTGSAAEFSDDYLDYLGRSFETQTWVYEQASGWIFWTWKTENANEWSFQDGITYGWIPQPLWAKPGTLGRPCQIPDPISPTSVDSAAVKTSQTTVFPLAFLIVSIVSLYL